MGYGEAKDKNMDEDIVEGALQMAATHRQPGEGILHHSDRGSMTPLTTTKGCSVLTRWYAA